MHDDIGGKRSNELSSFRFEDTGGNLDTFFSQSVKHGARHRRVWIPGAYPDIPDPFPDDKIRAGWCFASDAAWFE